MSTFRDIPLNIIDGNTLLGRSMYNVNKEAHDFLAKQMAEWEKRNKVTVLPIGASAEFDQVRKKRDQTIKPGTFTAASMTRKREKGRSGHQNLLKRKGNNFAVVIGAINLGTFPEEEAVRVRDSYRLKNNLPAAEY